MIYLSFLIWNLCILSISCCNFIHFLLQFYKFLGAIFAITCNILIYVVRYPKFNTCFIKVSGEFCDLFGDKVTTFVQLRYPLWRYTKLTLFVANCWCWCIFLFSESDEYKYTSLLLPTTARQLLDDALQQNDLIIFNRIYLHF